MSNLWLPTAAALALLAGQPPDAGKTRKGPPDEEKAILEEIREAYKAPHEVPQDLVKELRRAYERPSPDREEEVLKEARRMYDLSGGREEAILRLIRAGYGAPMPGHVDRVLAEIHAAPRLPEGAVPPSVQANQSRKLFGRFDASGDGVLAADELPETLKADRGRWDANRDGLIDQAEYAAYHQGRLRRLSEQVVAGQIDLKLKRGGPSTPPPDTARSADTPPAADDAEKRPAVFRAGKLPPGLPDWFLKLDADGDGQVGLYEWKTSARPLTEFTDIDRTADGLLTPKEMLRYLAEHPEAKAAVPSTGKSKKQ